MRSNFRRRPVHLYIENTQQTTSSENELTEVSILDVLLCKWARAIYNSENTTKANI